MSVSASNMSNPNSESALKVESANGANKTLSDSIKNYNEYLDSANRKKLLKCLWIIWKQDSNQYLNSQNHSIFNSRKLVNKYSMVFL